MIYRIEMDDENRPFKPDVSIAISLKRIADALEKLIAPDEKFERAMTEIEREEQDMKHANNYMFNKS